MISPDKMIDVLLSEYREVQAEKRLIAQALLATTALLAAGLVAISSAVTPDNSLPAAMFAPVLQGSIWVAVALNSLADEYVVYLSVLEERIAQIANAPVPPMWWNSAWARGLIGSRTPHMPSCARRITSAGPMLAVGAAAGVALLFVGLYAASTSPLIGQMSFPYMYLMYGAYVVFNVALLAGALRTWVIRKERLLAARLRFREVHRLSDS